jgi:hypothetical protein
VIYVLTVMFGQGGPKVWKIDRRCWDYGMRKRLGGKSRQLMKTLALSEGNRTVKFKFSWEKVGPDPPPVRVDRP